MKLLVNSLAVALLLSSHFGFSNNNFEKEIKTEEKTKTVSTTSSLPEFITVTDTPPAPQENTRPATGEHPERKAASVELKSLNTSK